MASTSDSAVQTMGDLQADIKRITSVERMVDHDVDQDADVRAGHRSAHAWWIPAQARYEPFRQHHGGEYYDACLTRVSDLADWFFQGHHNYIEPHVWTDL
jgi:hypothetical protein